MASNIIDALVVTLGLDSSKFSEGQNKARKEISDTKDAEKKRTDAAVAASKEMQRAAESVVGAYQKVRTEILGLFGILLAGRGLKQFFSEITQGDASMGYMAQSLGMATDELAAWQQVAEKSGGTAEGITGSFSKLSQTIANFTNFGVVDQAFNQTLSRLGVSMVDPATNKIKSLSELLKEIAVPLSQMAAPDAIAYGAQLGLDAGTVQTLRQNGGGRPALESALGAARANGVPNADDVARAQKLLNIFYDIKKTVEDIGREMLRIIDPELTKDLQDFEDYLKSHKEEWAEDFKYVYEQVKLIVSEVNAAISSTIGWKIAMEAFFAIWLGGQFAAVLTAIGALVSALGLIAPVLAGLGLGAFAKWVDDMVPSLKRLDEATTDWFRHLLGLPPIDRSDHSPVLGSAGGLAAGSAVSGSVPPEGRAFLNAMSAGESDGTYADQINPKSGARGRYQFLNSTWGEVSKQTGLSEWTPENQDQNAWFYAQQMFKRNGGPGGDLGAYLRSGGDPSPWLNKTWTSLPGGEEHNGATNGFNSRLGAYMRREQNAIPNGANPAITGGIGPQSMRLPSVWDNQMAGSRAMAANNNVTIGDVHVHTAATDAKGIARDVKSALQRQLFTSQFNTGLA